MSTVSSTPYRTVKGTGFKGYLFGKEDDCFYHNPIWLEPQIGIQKYYDRKRSNTIHFKFLSSYQDEVNAGNFTKFLTLLKGISEPLCLEILCKRDDLMFLVTCGKRYSQIIKGAVGAIYPQSFLEKQEEDPILESYRKVKNSRDRFGFNFLDINFKGPNFLNIRTSKKEFSPDPLELLCQIFLELKDGEIGFYQLLFTPTSKNWPRCIRQLFNIKDEWETLGECMSDIKKGLCIPDSQLPFYEMQVKEKLQFPLFVATPRIGLFCYKNRLNSIINTVRKIFESFDSRSRHSSVFTRKDYYEHGIKKSDHMYLLLNRISFRLGSLFSANELASLYHFPTKAIMERDWSIPMLSRSYSAPKNLTSDGEIIGANYHKGVKQDVRISKGFQNRHAYICGASGCGKSTLLQNLALQHLEKGEGFGVIDPHGELITNLILPYIPKDRIKDVVYFHPLKTKPAFNILAHDGSEFEKEFIRADLIKIVTEMLDAPLGVNIGLVLNSILKTLLQERDSTLEDIYSLLLDSDYRKRVVYMIKDVRLKRFWEKEFPCLAKQPATITGITNKLDLFLSSHLISPMLRQKQSKIDFHAIMNTGKIFLCNLSHGDIHEENSQFLGRLIASKIQTAAMRRKGSFRDFYLLIDEFQNFLTPSIKTILTGGRKYKLHLTLANQEIRDIPDNILRNVLGSSTIILFGSNEPRNKEYGEKILLKKFSGEEIGKLGRGVAFVKMGSNVFNIDTYPSPAKPKQDHTQEIIEFSKKLYGGKEEECQKETSRLHTGQVENNQLVPTKPKRGKIIETSEEFDVI